MKKVISIALAAIMLLCMIPTVAVFANTQEPTRDTSWYSDDTSTFEISTAAQLLGFSDLLADGKTFSGKTVKLTADIDLNEGWTAGETAPANVWGAVAGQSFKGTFDGQAHSISGVYLSTTDVSGTGIFGKVEGTAATPASISNLVVTNSYVTSNSTHTAGIAGLLKYAKLDNLHVDVDVVSTARYTGGIATNLWNTVTISDCIYVGDVTGTSEVGGIAGWVDTCNLTMKRCAVYGNVTGTAGGGYHGTLIGAMYNRNNAGYTVNIESCIAAGLLKSVVHGLAGSFYGGAFTGEKVVITLTDSYCTRVVLTTNNTEQTKPFPTTDGKNALPTGVTANDFGQSSDYVANRKTNANFKGPDAVLPNGYVAMGTGVYTLPRRVAALLEGEVLEVSPMAADHWYTLELEDSTPALFVIDSAEDMLAFSEALEEGIDFAGKTVELACDVDLNEGWTAGATAPTNTWKLVSEGKAFAGTFDGKGNTVSGIYMNTQLAGMGIFGNVTGGQVTVKNLAIVNSYIESIKGTLGGLFGSVAGEVTVSGVYLDVDMVNAYTSYTDRAYGMGGFVGSVAAGGSLTFEDCVSAGYIKTTKSNSQRGIQGVGGFVGTADAQCNVSATDSAFLGTLESKANVAGGFIGKIGDGTSTDVTVALTNVIVGGKLSTGDPDYNGSFCGQLVSGTLTATNCYHIKYNNAGELGTRPVYGTAGESLDGATLVSDMDIRGADTSAWLTEKGLTEWTATDGYPLPTALVGMTSADAIPGLGNTPNDTVPEKPNDGSDGSENSDGKADGGDTEEDGGDETSADSAADDTEEKKGCGSVALGGIVLMTLAAGAATTLSRKKKEN